MSATEYSSITQVYLLNLVERSAILPWKNKGSRMVSRPLKDLARTFRLLEQRIRVSQQSFAPDKALNGLTILTRSLELDPRAQTVMPRRAVMVHTSRHVLPVAMSARMLIFSSFFIIIITRTFSLYPILPGNGLSWDCQSAWSFKLS